MRTDSMLCHNYVCSWHTASSTSPKKSVARAEAIAASPKSKARLLSGPGQLLTCFALSWLQVYDEPTVLVAKRVTGEEEVPEGAVAVLTPDAPDVLSHVSVRARNMKVLFAICHEEGTLKEVEDKEGTTISLQVSHLPAPSAVHSTLWHLQGHQAYLRLQELAHNLSWRAFGSIVQANNALPHTLTHKTRTMVSQHSMIQNGSHILSKPPSVGPAGRRSVAPCIPLQHVLTKLPSLLLRLTAPINTAITPSYSYTSHWLSHLSHPDCLLLVSTP